MTSPKVAERIPDVIRARGTHERLDNLEEMCWRQAEDIRALQAQLNALEVKRRRTLEAKKAWSKKR